MHFEDYLYAMIVIKVQDILQFKMKLSSWLSPPISIKKGGFALTLVFTKSAQYDADITVGCTVDT